MTHHYLIWGKYGSDKLESLLVETVNGDYIHTRAQAKAVMRYWQEKIRQGQLDEVRDWRISKVEYANHPDFYGTVNI